MSVEFVDVKSIDPMVREVNKGLMVQWINADLVDRAYHDVRKSMVVYDKDFMFMTAIPQGVELTDGVLQALYDKFGVRYVSEGV